MLAPAEGDLRKSDALALAQCAAHGGHGARLRFVFGDEEVRPLEERGVDGVTRDKVFESHSLLSGQAKALEIFRLDDEIFSLFVLVSLGDILCCPHIFIVCGLAMVDPLAGLAIDFVEGYLPSRRACRHNANSKGDE